MTCSKYYCTPLINIAKQIHVITLVDSRQNMSKYVKHYTNVLGIPTDNFHLTIHNPQKSSIAHDTLNGLSYTSTSDKFHTDMKRKLANIQIEKIYRKYGNFSL
jgi:hypothetical protein